MKAAKYFIIAGVSLFLSSFSMAQENPKPSTQTSIPEKKIPDSISKRIDRNSGKVNPGVGPKISRKIILERRSEIKSIPASKQ